MRRYIKLQPRGRDFAIIVPRDLYCYFRDLLNTNFHPVDVRPIDSDAVLRGSGKDALELQQISTVFIVRAQPKGR